MILKMLESHPNLEIFIKSLIGQEADARRIFMHSATSVDLTANQGWEERVKDHHGRFIEEMRRVGDLSLALYMHTLAKLIIDK